MISVHLIPPEFDDKKDEWFKAKNNTSWYYESIANKDNLLVTIGESWTWGDSLGKIDINAGITDDYNHRVTHVFGHLLRTKLNADWCNMARCGYSNSWIIEQCSEIVRITNTLDLGYKNITIVCTLTELCRDIYASQMYTIATQLIKISNTLDEFLCQYENEQLLQIKQIANQAPSNVRIVIGRNFTDTYTENIATIPDLLVPKTWCDIINDKFNYKDYINNSRIVGQIGFDPLIRFLREQKKYSEWKKELLVLFDSALNRTNFLDHSPYNYKQATKHPTEKGHEFWADYLESYLTKIL